MIPKYVSRSLVYKEFSNYFKDEWFNLTSKKVIHNIDTFYYNIFLKDDGFNEDNIFIKHFIDYLEELKSEASATTNREIYISDNIVFKPFRFTIYDYRFTYNNFFDIFIARVIPNNDTPRIQVQLRSVGIWTKGIEALINESFNFLTDFLNANNVEISEVRENRIDFCYHTNSIQDTSKVFSTDNVQRHCKSSFTLGQNVFRFGSNGVTVDYLALGKRQSNNIFFRAYNKVREVIEQNYKGFFIDYWYQSGLINAYDKYVYSYAFEKRSYNAVHIGRINWYLEYGTDNGLKARLKHILDKYSLKSDNSMFLEKSIKGLLPNVTAVTNIEFQTKRKFYHTMDKFINDLPCSLDKSNNLFRLFQIIDNRKPFLNYLTTFTVRFVKNRSVALKDEVYCDFWKRIVCCTLPSKVDNSVVRDYSRSIDIKRVTNNITNSIATFSVYKNKTNSKSFKDDFCDYLSYLNDNDFSGQGDLLVDVSSGEAFRLNNSNYLNIKTRHNRRLKGVVDDV